jgi:Arc/MetJ-type ribon-helix-helix transcriptional regulator
VNRMSIRLDEELQRQLSELRDLLALRSDSECVRALIRLHYAATKAERARLRAARTTK